MYKSHSLLEYIKKNKREHEKKLIKLHLVMIYVSINTYHK